MAVVTTLNALTVSRSESGGVNLKTFTSGWGIVPITLVTVIPWGVIAIWDAVDAKYRTRNQVAARLWLSTLCLLLAYASGLLFLVSLTVQIFEDDELDRHDEVASIMVLLIFNLWHVARNLRGWSQFLASYKLEPMFRSVQTNFSTYFPSRNPDGACIQGLTQLRVSDRLFDNDFHSKTPFLSPFFQIGKNENDPANERWALAMWRAWWTQDTRVPGLNSIGLSVSERFHCDAEHRYASCEDLMDTDPPLRSDRDVINEQTGEVIRNKRQWADALATYGTEEGQQDTHGRRVPDVMNTADATGIAILIEEKITRIPNRMSALWYNTARFEEVYQSEVMYLKENRKFRHILLPQWRSWLNIAQDIGTALPRPIYLSDSQLISYAGELASSSLLLTGFAAKYSQLVEQIYEDGLKARWTFGWSGLLACFTHLWTKERIYIAMLNGLSLLALVSAEHVRDINENVRSMLYGYAAFEVSDRAVGKRIANDRKAELLRRYMLNKGKTCRGVGLFATRLACRSLHISAEASHMDGLPSFSSGWCSEYMQRKPGNQTPEHGNDHDEVERLQGSSNVWRYPHSCT